MAEKKPQKNAEKTTGQADQPAEKWTNRGSVMMKEFNFEPPPDIGKNDREKQMDWAMLAANYTTCFHCVRLFKDVSLYSQSTMKEYRRAFPEPDRDYSGAAYWLVKERTGEVIPMHNVRDIADFFHFNKDYWESMER